MTKFMNILKSQKGIHIAEIIVLLLFMLRIVGLDKDLPSFGLTFYQSKDEGQYSMMALNYYNYGSLTVAGDMELVCSPLFRPNILSNLLQYLTLKILGDNYYGFRLPYVLFSFVTLFLLYQIMKIIVNRYNCPSLLKWIALFLIAYMIFDFNYLMVSRCAENTAVRMFATILTVFFWYKYIDDVEIRYFLLGLMSIVSIFLVYFSNVHILGASCIILFCDAITEFRKGKFTCVFLKIRYWLQGIITGIVLSEIYYILVWKTGCFYNFFSAIMRFPDRMNVSDNKTNIFFSCLNGAKTYLASNMFFYNFSIGVLGLTAFFVLFFGTIRLNRKNDLFVLSLEFMIVFQSIFTDDWMERKSVCIYPVIILNIFITLIYVYKGEIVLSPKLKYCAILFGLCIPVFLYALISVRMEEKYFLDFEKSDIICWFIFTTIEVFCLVYLLVYCCLHIKKLYSIIYTGIAASILLNCYFSLKYVYNYNEYTEKNTMIAIGDLVGTSYVAGPYTYGFTLYNELLPVWNVDNYCRDYIEEGKIVYFCDYIGPYYVTLMNPKQDFDRIALYERSINAMGDEYPICIYQKAKMNDTMGETDHENN